jgi:hypothetical protein
MVENNRCLESQSNVQSTPHCYLHDDSGLETWGFAKASWG